MKGRAHLVTLLLGISATILQVSAFPTETDTYDDTADYNNDADEGSDIDDDTGPPAKLVTQPQNFSVHLGATLKLPCKIENQAEAVVQWRRNNDPLFFDKSKQIADVRYSLDEKDMTLTVQNVKPVDEAVFQCIIIGENQAVDHRVEVISSPMIKKIVPDSDVALKLGQPLTFMCEATGNPQPKVMWKTKLDKEDNKLIESNVIAYDKLEGHHSGKYTCIAENNRGERDEKTVVLIVKAPPVVEVMSQVVNSAEKYESELQCLVKSFYNATNVKVSWMKDGTPIQVDRRHYEILSEGGKHILRISATKREDFGSYACVAKNEFGSSQAQIILVGSPLKPEFLSTELTEQKNPLLKWSVVSKASIESYEIIYKRQQDDDYLTITLKGPQQNSSTHILSHQFVNLQPDTYEARVRAKNVYGFSPMSDQKFFPGGSGYPADSAMQSKYLEQVPGSSASSLRVSLVAVLSFLAARFVR